MACRARCVSISVPSRAVGARCRGPGWSRLQVAPEALRRATPDAALPRSRELRLGSQQVREAEQQRETLAILLKTPVADLRVPEVPLHVEKRMLSLRTHRGLPPLRLCLLAPRRQLPPETRAHRHLPAQLRPRVLRALLRSLVAGIAPQRGLSSVQQAMRLGHIGHVRRRRAHAVDQPPPALRRRGGLDHERWRSDGEGNELAIVQRVEGRDIPARAQAAGFSLLPPPAPNRRKPTLTAPRTLGTHSSASM